MKKITGMQLFLLLVCAAVLAYSMCQITAVGDHLQYMTDAPQPVASADPNDKTKPNQALADLAQRLTESADEWRDTMRLWSMDGVVEKATFTSADAGALSSTGRLTLLGARGQELRGLVLRFGRMIYPEELERGDRVILLDEPLALALFRVGDPIDRLVRLGEEEYRVVGVVKHGKRVGDTTDHGAYIPLSSVIDVSFSVDTLLVEAAPKKGVGAAVSFRTVVESWRSGGTLIDLGKESTGAWLWLRVLLFVSGLLLALRAIRALNGGVRRFHRSYRQRLLRSYAVRLLPWAAGCTLGLAVGYLLCAAVLAALMELILAPVYVFPEWVPSVLVEWSDIGDTFWKVWQGFAAMHELRTPELMRLRFFTLLTDGFSALAGVMLAMIYARTPEGDRRAAQALCALKKQGIAVVTAETDQPLRHELMGYAAMEDAADGMVRMRRIIDPQKTLTMLPPSAVDGEFVLEVTDEQIPGNQVRLLIRCAEGRTWVEETGRMWDLQLTIQALTRLIYGDRDFRALVETEPGCDLKMRSPAMDGLFANHLN